MKPNGVRGISRIALKQIFLGLFYGTGSAHAVVVDSLYNGRQIRVLERERSQIAYQRTLHRLAGAGIAADCSNLAQCS